MRLVGTVERLDQRMGAKKMFCAKLILCYVLVSHM
jgi:hypothetical protein